MVSWLCICLTSMDPDTPFSLSLPVTPSHYGRLDKPLTSLPGLPQQACGRSGRWAQVGVSCRPYLSPYTGVGSYLLLQAQWSPAIQQSRWREDSRREPSADPGPTSKYLLEHSCWVSGAPSASMDITLLPCQGNSPEDGTCSTGVIERRWRGWRGPEA